MPTSILLHQSLESIKTMIETAIRTNGEAGKRSVITSSVPINILHEMVKADLVTNGVRSGLVRPATNEKRPEVRLAGFLKFKTQDVCVFPNHLTPNPAPIGFNGLHTGMTDPYGELFSEHVLTVNLRSQLSSIAKNKDTMYERTYAEPLNLHRRLPKMVLGEVYLLSARELDSGAVARREVVYRPASNQIARALEEYIHGFAALNGRASQGDDFFKYERVALVIADFSQSPVKVYNSAEDLRADNLLPAESRCSLAGMTYDGFIPDLLRIHATRFGSGILT